MRKTGRILVMGLLVSPVFAADVADTAASTSQSTAGERLPAKIWNRTEPLGETPQRVTDAYPLSDQQNHGGWRKFEPMSDEFDGNELNRTKWTLGLEWWKGRPPALFSDKNVTVAEGKLHLTMRKEKLPPDAEALGYHDYTSAAVHTKARSACGYYEVAAKPMNSAGSSAFWFQQDETPGWGTEIDVFEIGGNAKQWERICSMTLHIYRSPAKLYRTGPNEGENWHSQFLWKAPWRPADAYHVYGLEWGQDEMKFYVDGVLVRSIENTLWHQPLYLIFDSETFPHWFGLPNDADLPSTFSIEYVRAWKKDSPGI